MISQGRSPILEKLLSNGNYPGTTAATNCDQNPEVTSDTSEFPYQFPGMNVENSYSNGINQQTFACETISTRSQVVPYFIDLATDNLTQASDIWSQSSIGQNGMHYFNPSVLCCTEDADFLPVSSLPAEANVDAGVPNFLSRVQEPSPFTMAPQQVLTDVHSLVDTNSQIENNTSWENPSNTTRQQFYNPTSNRLRHFTLPLNHLSYQQDNVYPDFSFNPTNQLYHDTVPYSNQTESSNTISTPYLGYNSTPTDSPGYYSQPQMQDSDEIPNQSLPNFYQFNFVQQTFFNQYLLESHANSQMCNEIQHASQCQTSNYLYASNDINLRQLSDICVNTCTRIPPWTILNSDTTSRNDEISEISTYSSISGTKPLSHQPLNTVKEPCTKSSCIHENDNATFVPKFREKLELVQTTKTEEKPLCLVKGANVSEKVKAQVDKFMKSPKKERRKWNCPVCGRTLTRASTLKIHLRQHSGDRPFKCPSCPKSFAQPSLLNSHHRLHSGERPFSCSLCHKTFAHLSAFRIHARTHTGERPHECPVPNCGMAFSDSSTLSKHTRVHSGEKPYLCGICNRRFTQSGNMNKHRRSVHKALTNAATMVKVPENTKMLSEILGNDENTTPTMTKV